MLRRIILAVLFLFLLLIQSHQGAGQGHLFFVIPFFFLGIFYLSAIQDLAAARVAVGFCFFLIVLTWIQTQDSAYLVFSLLLMAAIGSLNLYIKVWNQKLDGILERKAVALQEKQALEERFRMRAENLKHLEGRVGGLIHLFEVARDFNECLDFSQLISVLDQKIVPELSLARGA